MPEAVKVLIVDDSAYMRVALKDMISSDANITVVATAKNGIEGIAQTKRFSPDVVLLDIQMPRMDGLATLKRIMKEHPTRVVMLSAMDKVDADLPLRALEMGAVEFLSKPGGPISVDIVKYRNHIIRTVLDVSGAKIEALQRSRSPLRLDKERLAPREIRDDKLKAIVIAASTGGPRAIEHVFSRLPRDIPAAIFVVQHLPAVFSESFSRRLDAVKGPRTTLADEGMTVERGHAYVAPGGSHLVLRRRSPSLTFIALDDSGPVQFVRPSADVLFRSAAECFRERVMAVVLTGMGMDSVDGALAVKAAGGKVLVQDERTSVIFGMPKAVADSGAADVVAALDDIPAQIVRFLED
ncbi:MAG: chemotaxis response regulator protein-glutamate methylesterase [Methanobacteriota archaeon]|nr:MAG: chemotaxis response regulator protein-glutamate methylesterase [Euryarchaeota archaeon]